MVIFHIKLKGITKYSSMVANILPTDPYSYPLLTLRLGSVGRNSTLSEHGFVAYQIKENHECNNMVANKLPADRPTPPPTPPRPWGWGKYVKNSTFSEHGDVAYQMKWNHEMQQHGSKYCARRPPSPYDSMLPCT